MFLGQWDLYGSLVVTHFGKYGFFTASALHQKVPLALYCVQLLGPKISEGDPEKGNTILYGIISQREGWVGVLT